MNDLLNQGMAAPRKRGLAYSLPFIAPIALVVTVLLQFAFAPAAFADELHADLVPLTLNARNGAPIPVEARFDWDGSAILEGHLEMEFHEGNRILGHYRSDEIALSSGEQKFRMLLPAPFAPISDSQVEVRMKFVTTTHVIDLDPSLLYMPTTGQRSLVLGWFEAATEAAQPSEVLRNLLFEHYAPSSEVGSERLLTTSISRQTAEDLPQEPLAYTSFDLIVLSATAFSEAHERQLQALARWVKGGGSVCVFVGGGLQPYHIAFLNQLAASASSGPAFLSDNSGNLVPPSQDIQCLHSGVGRSVIITGEKATTFNLDNDSWREVAVFLWKMRGSQARAIAESGHWQLPSILRGPNRTPSYYTQYAQPFSLAMQPTSLGAELLDRLMPKTVRLIPFPALIGLLVLFLVVVGPADYYGLGFFRRRRFTWVLFPLTSIVFTVVTVLMANHYLGLRDQRSSLIVVDLDKDGSALRWNRYELVFTARDKQAVTDLKNALWSPMETQISPFNNPPYTRLNYRYNSRAYGYSSASEDEADPPQYDGVLPVHFTTSEAIRQWQPKLNRIFSFEPPPVPLPANWNAIEQAWPSLEDIRAKLSENKPFTGDLFAIFSSSPMTTSLFSGILDSSILNEICAGSPGGLQFLISQISPTGGSSFEDLPAMDIQSHDSALLIVTKSGDDIIVYRRFFYGN